MLIVRKKNFEELFLLLLWLQSFPGLWEGPNLFLHYPFLTIWINAFDGFSGSKGNERLNSTRCVLASTFSATNVSVIFVIFWDPWLHCSKQTCLIFCPVRRFFPSDNAEAGKVCHSKLNNFWTVCTTEKLRTVLESWMLQLSKTMCSFTVRLLVQKLLALKVDSEKFMRDRSVVELYWLDLD